MSKYEGQRTQERTANTEEGQGHSPHRVYCTNAHTLLLLLFSLSNVFHQSGFTGNLKILEYKYIGSKSGKIS